MVNNNFAIGSVVVTPRGERGRIIEIRTSQFDGTTEALVMLDAYTVPHVWPLAALADAI
jgi:hypothetical protein